MKLYRCHVRFVGTWPYTSYANINSIRQFKFTFSRRECFRVVIISEDININYVAYDLYTSFSA